MWHQRPPNDVPAQRLHPTVSINAAHDADESLRPQMFLRSVPCSGKAYLNNF